MNGNDGNLRAMIRFIRVARALRDEVHEVENLELAEGSSDLLVGSAQRLLSNITKLSDDPFVASLGEGLEGLADDAQKALAVRLVLSQLIAFLETETGVAGLVSPERHGPQYSIGQVYGMSPDDVARMTGVAKGKREDKPEEG